LKNILLVTLTAILVIPLLVACAPAAPVSTGTLSTTVEPSASVSQTPVLPVMQSTTVKPSATASQTATVPPGTPSATIKPSVSASQTPTVLPGTIKPVDLKSEKTRLTAPVVSSSDNASLMEGNRDFALNLYQEIKGTDGNLFFSPYSISEALAMSYGGARSETEKQMAAALKFKLPQAQLHPAFNSLDQDLATRGQGAKGKDGQGFRLNVANAIWGQQGFNFTPAYLDLLAQNYGAGMRIVDFKSSAEPSRLVINQWVSDQTEGKIKEVLPQGSVDDMTRLVLTNAVYFNAAWLSRFNKEATASDVFHPLTGNDISLPMMKNKARFKYLENDSLQAVELPYSGHKLSMVILLPGADKFKFFESALTGPGLSSLIQQMQDDSVKLTMPKFSFSSQIELKEALSQLGMPEAFTDKADFSGMDGQKDLLIEDVVHQAFVAVDEDGTEAAAATGISLGATSIELNFKEMKVDRPFIFIIRDIPTNSIIFIGRVTNPAN